MSSSRFKQVLQELSNKPKKWLVTGVAGFIGSNILEKLLRHDQIVVGLDNFSTGHQHNLDDVQRSVSPSQWNRFTFYQGDIRDLSDCQKVVDGVDYVLHQAALGSVPRSIQDPIASNDSNVTGFLNMLVAARDAKVSSFTYAASSSTYGDHPDLPKVEDKIGNPLSPYAVTKYVNELYANVFARTYDFRAIGLRYFNVFGPRQDPNGAYAAVIPKWIGQLIQGESIKINGDGETSRDFCYVENAVQANILAATASNDAKGQVYNVAVGDKTSLNELALALIGKLEIAPGRERDMIVYGPQRLGDVRHSQADISKISNLLGYDPMFRIRHGLDLTCDWFSTKRSVTATT